MINYHIKTSFLYLLLCFLVFISPAFAYENIIISGNQRIESSAIKSYFNDLKFDKNFKKNLETIRKDLIESELFSTVSITTSDKTITVDVAENPIIYETKFIGNKKIDDDILAAETSLKKRSIFTKNKLQNDIKRINEIYIKSGRFLSQVEPKIIQKDQNRIELIYEINEGSKAKIGEIYFIGNKNFSDRELNEEISTKKTIWWKFLSSSDIFDSDRLEYDKELLRRFYNNNGFADFNTISAIAQINRNRDNFFITFHVEEGIKYSFGEITIENRLKKFDPDVLTSKILIKTNKIYNADLIQKSIDNMIETMSEMSYAFADIEPILTRDKDKKTIDIKFVINETPRIFIDQINILGNTRTYDEVIRRELRIREGDPYNLNKINRSKQRLENLNYFEKVEINNTRIGESDRVILDIVVKEKRTGELNLGLGYSTINRANVNAGIRENNLFGTGRKISFNVQKSYFDYSVDLGYTKPYFLGRPLEAGFDIFKINQSKLVNRPFETNNLGFNLNFGYNISEFTTHSITYSYKQQNIGNISPSAQQFMQILAGDFTYSLIQNTIFYDQTNNRFNPSKGYFASLTNVYSGLGGNMNYASYTANAGYFIPTFNNNFVLFFNARGGIIDGLGEDVNTQNNFFLGGNDFRGFQFRGIGPRSKQDANSSFGGKIFYVGTVEYRFPLGLPRELGISGALFWNSGTLKGVDKSIKNNNPIYDSGTIRSAAGLSISWASPVGPIRLDFSKIIKQAHYDRTQTFNLNLGTNF